MTRLACLAALLLFVAHKTDLDAKAQDIGGVGDESATLIAAARTDHSAFLVVDSGVSNGKKLRSDPSSKLFEAGRAFSCGLTGHLSYTSGGKVLFQMADAARSAVLANSALPFSETMPAILNAMGNNYLAELAYVRKQNSQPTRRPGQPITAVLCAGFAGGRPKIVEGDIELRTTDKVSFGSAESPEIFTIGGVIPLSDVVGEGTKQEEFRRYFYHDPSAAAAFQKFLVAYKSRKSSAWDDSDVQQLLTPLFEKVEDDTTQLAESDGRNLGVVRPNNVRVISKGGKRYPDFESPAWAQ